MCGVLIMLGDSNMPSWTHKKAAGSEKRQRSVRSEAVWCYELCVIRADREREWGRQWLSKGGLERWNERGKERQAGK